MEMYFCVNEEGWREMKTSNESRYRETQKDNAHAQSELWSEQAALDLERLITYIASENPKMAGQILKKIKTEVSQLDYLPFRGRIVPEFEEQGFLLFQN